MKTTDVELINRILNGDDTAFTELVKKYQKPVHALVWRKIGDFHIAEEITQDTFLKTYQGLATLKKPQSFVSWLYVIATNNCNTWLRKKRVWTQPLEDTNFSQFGKATYSQYVIEENERTAVEAQREVVKKLLAKLPESDRTIITLYYFSDMSSAEIGAFLGVSANTIRSRLRRAQQRLQEEETMIREALDHFQISPNLTDNIMREVARLKPAAPSGSKPLVPWAVAASSLVLIVLMLGIGSQRLVRFQKPYSLDAQAEMPVELVDAPIVLNFEAESDVRRELGNTNVFGKSDNNGQKPDEILLAAAQAEGENNSVPKQQWIQSEPVKGSDVGTLLVTSEGELYAFEILSLYKLPADGKEWQYIFDGGSLVTAFGGNISIAKWKNTLYIIPYNELFASKDDGKTWDLVHSWSDQHSPIKLILTEQAFYAAFENGIISRSEDTGKTWEVLNDGIMGRIGSLVRIQNTLFAGTDTGLYRLNADSWERIKFPVPTIGQINSVAATEETLYVAAQLSWDVLNRNKVYHRQQRAWWIFRSTDLGDSWQDITPTNAWPVKGLPPFIKLVAAGETLLVMERGMVRSTDGGNTWMPPQLTGTSPEMDNRRSAVVNADTIYVGSWDGLHRSTDGGKSWDIVKITPDESRIDNLIAFKETDSGQNMLPTLYGRVGEDIVKTTYEGKSWKAVQVEIPMTAPFREDPPRITQIVKFGGVIYAKGGDHHAAGELRLYRVSADGRTLAPFQGMPGFDSMSLRNQVLYRNKSSQNPSVEQLQESTSGATQFFKQLAQGDARALDPDPFALIRGGFHGPFAVSDNTFYIEYNFKLFRWKPGDTEWYDIGQEETVELSLNIVKKELKLAVSGNTVYVGKRDGHLVVSFDRGNNWIDLTPALPFPVKTFKEISNCWIHRVCSNRRGYHYIKMMEDIGILSPMSDGTNLIMEHLAIDGTTVYGVTENTGAYRLKSGILGYRLLAEIPDNVTSLAVDGDTLYVGTENRGMLHFNLEK